MKPFGSFSDLIPRILRGKPFTYLNLIPKNTSCIEVLKGCIVTLVGKMAVADGPSGKVWLVKVAFTDGSSTITASLAPKMVEDVFGFSPAVNVKTKSVEKRASLINSIVFTLRLMDVYHLIKSQPL